MPFKLIRGESYAQRSAFKAFSKIDGRTMWLKEVLYYIKRGILWFVGSKESCMQKNQGPESRDEKSDMPFEQFSRKIER